MPAVLTSQAQIGQLLRHALVTRVTAGTLAEQIEEALRDVPATEGNRLPEPLQTMQEVAEVLRNLAPDRAPDPAVLREPELRLRIAHLEALVERLTAQLRNETAARQAAEAMAAKDGFVANYRKELAKAAAWGTIPIISVGVPTAAVYFLGASHPLVEAFLTVMGRPPR
jgi:uncharacterized small protein (DUF1192 family)